MLNMDIIGSFWPASRPDKCVPGRLTFEPAEGGRLDLLGAFHDPKEVIDKARAQQPDGPVSVGFSELFGLDTPPVRILGDASDGPVTLDRCLLTNQQHGHRTQSSIYHVPLIFQGAHFLENERIRFEAAQFDVHHLVHWIGQTGLDVSLRHPEDTNQVEQVRITNTPVEKTIVETQCGDHLSLNFEYQLCGDRIVESTIKQNCILELRFAVPGSVGEIFETHHALQALITIGVAAPVRVTQVRVKAPGGHWLKVHAHVGDGAHSGDAPTLRRWNMLFTYRALGGLSGIERWLAMSKKFRPVIGMLMSHWYEPNLYGELQFFQMVTAAETFARIRLQQQNFNWSKELKNLACHAGHPFQSVVYDVRKWAERVVRTRINYVVHRGLRGDPDGEPLYWLTSSLYVLVVLCLLRECEVPEENLPNLETCPWMATIARKL